MPRKAREISSTGMYHIMIKGVPHLNIFEQERDKDTLEDLIFSKRATLDFKLYAYCILDNHLHLSIHEKSYPISQVIKGLALSYGRYFSKKYNPNERIFCDRFKSEEIKSNEHLLENIRFVHNNPVTHEKITTPDDYRWSSIGLYNNNDLANRKKTAMKKDTEEVLSLFEEEEKDKYTLFKEYTEKSPENFFCDFDCLDKDLEKMKNSLLAKEILERYNITKELLNIDREVLKVIILLLRNEHNIPLRQIAEILQINRGLVQRLSMP